MNLYSAYRLRETSNAAQNLTERLCLNIMHTA